ncbi:MAG: CNP1-like family protein [Pseudomonadota bacterium]
MRRLHFAFLTLGLALSQPVLPATTSEATVWGSSYGLGKDLDRDFDENAKPWQEIQAQLPPYPKAENLVPFEVSAATGNRHFVDFPSVTIGSDGAVRYSVVVRSPAGAETVSFEGMRCDSGERKLYAFGRSDGKGGGEWSRNRYAKWDIIKDRQQTSYHRELFYHYFCTVDGKGDLKRIQHFLKTGGLYNR